MQTERRPEYESFHYLEWFAVPPTIRCLLYTSISMLKLRYKCRCELNVPYSLDSVNIFHHIFTESDLNKSIWQISVLECSCLILVCLFCVCVRDVRCYRWAPYGVTRRRGHGMVFPFSRRALRRGDDGAFVSLSNWSLFELDHLLPTLGVHRSPICQRRLVFVDIHTLLLGAQ